MPQHDMNVANATRTAVRGDINDALVALYSQQEGASAPASPVAHSLWADTSSSVVRRRNASNTAWLYHASLAQALVSARSSNTALAVGDFNTTIVATSTFTQTLTAAATLGAGWLVNYRNDGTGVITLDPNSTEQIDGATTLILPPKTSCVIICDGTGFKTVGIDGRKQVTDAHFGALGGASDDVTPLTNTFNFILTNTDYSLLMTKMAYSVSAALPRLSRSGIVIKSAFGRSSNADVGTPKGSVIKKIGSASSAAVIEIGPVSGAGNQRLTGLDLQIAVDGNSLADKCILVESVEDCDLDLFSSEAVVRGIEMGVVATLGEARDMRGNRVNAVCRQTSAAGIPMVITGDATANVSMFNEIYLSALHKNTAALHAYNEDNNDYWLDTHVVGGGTATTAAEFHGGATSAQRARASRVRQHSGDRTIYVHGVGGIASYAVGANLDVYREDGENGTPATTYESGATGSPKRDSTRFGDAAWQVMTVTPVPNTGAFGAMTASWRYRKRGKHVHANLTLFGTNGTGGGAYVSVPLPYAEAGAVYWTFFGDDAVTQNKMIKGVITPNATSILLRLAAAGIGYPFVTGDVLNIAVDYETA